MNLPVEQNTLSDITGTAIVIDGSVLAPIRSNSIDGAQTGLAVADDAEVATLTDNEFTNIQQPGDEERLRETEDTETSEQDGTADETVSGAETETTATPEDGVETEANNPSESDSGASGPGFGIGSALVSLGTAGYLLQRRLSDDETGSE